MHTEYFAEFVKLESRKAELKKDLEKTQKRLNELDELVRNELVSNGVPDFPIKVEGTNETRRVYVRRDIYTSPHADQSRYDVVQALKKCEDLAHYVHEDYHESSLRAWVREIVEHIEDECVQKGIAPNEAYITEALPAPLRAALKVGFKYTAHSTKVAPKGQQWEKEHS